MKRLLLAGVALLPLAAVAQPAPVESIPNKLVGARKGVADLDANGRVSTGRNPYGTAANGGALATAAAHGAASATFPIATMRQLGRPLPSAAAGRANSLIVQAPSETSPLSMAVRLGATVDVRGFGAKLDGISNDYQAFVAAQAQAQSVGGAIIDVPARSKINLGGQTIYTISGNTWRFGPGVKIRSGNIQGVTDGLANGFSWTRSTSATGNESLLFGSLLVNPPPSGTPSYQKNGLYVRLYTYAPSTYMTGAYADLGVATYDTVGFESQAIIGAGNTAGRAWGYHAACTIEATANGYCNAGEFESYNNGAYQPLEGKADTKNGLHVDAMGSVDSTTAVSISGTQHWLNGLLLDRAALRSDGWLWAMRDRPQQSDTARRPVIAGVDWNGRETVTQLAVGAPGFGKTQTITLAGTTTPGTTRAELTTDGLAAGTANTLTLPTNSGMLIKSIRLLAFDKTTGWTASYHWSDVLASEGATATSIVTAPASPAATFDQQIGPSPGSVATSLGTNAAGRVALTVVQSSSTDTIVWTASVDYVSAP